MTATAFLALGTAGVANAADLNWSGTLLIDMVELGVGKVSGGGVATVNGSAGAFPLTSTRCASRPAAAT